MCHPPAVVLHGRLIALAHLARSFALALDDAHSNGFPFFPVPKNKMLLAACGADLQNKSSRPERVQSVSSPPVDAQSPSTSVVESSLLPAQFPPLKPRLRHSLARGGACFRARASRLSIAAPPLLPKKIHESLVTMPNAPGTTQLLPPRLSLAATRSNKKVSLHEGESGLTPARKTPPPLDTSLLGHASQHALPRRQGERRRLQVFVGHSLSLHLFVDIFLLTPLLSSFWTSRGLRCRPSLPRILPSIFIAHRVQ